jgi:ubiquinone/menaquinone biosynthesis C-methylase UbiE
MNYRHMRIDHWDSVAQKMDRWKGWGRSYHRRLTEVYHFLVSPGQRVLEVGCSRGDLLAALKPSVGVGVDFSSEMISRARQRHPELQFILADAHEMELDGPFDVIVCSDLIHDLWDVQGLLKQVSKLCDPSTRIILNYYSRLWELPLALASSLDLAKPVLNQNWLTVEDVTNLLRLENMEVIRHWQEVLFPLPIPLIAPFFNRFLVKIFPFNLFALTNFILARPVGPGVENESNPIVSVVIPARNEAGNIEDIFNRTPEMGAETELVFVEGHSKDDTYTAIEKAIQDHPQRPCKLVKQVGKGKGDAVRKGFTIAGGDVFMILDADLTVPPEDLPRFYDALVSDKAEFINGVRLVYPMEKKAMQLLNFIGNKFFSLVFSWLLGQPIKDTLCGTKAIWKKDYERIAANRNYFGEFDPFGDYDLIFGATKLGLKIIDLPIRYRERTYGTTNIQRWKHGWLLLKMVAFAAVKIKFI